MAKRGRHTRHARGGRVTPKGTRPPGARDSDWTPPSWDAEPDLLRDVRHHLRSGAPVDLLGEVSSLLTVLDEREYGFGRHAGEPPYTVPQLVDMFLDVRRSETSALLAVIAVLAADDELMTARIRRELAQRADQLPDWLARLDEVDVYRTQEMVHVLGDGDNIHLAVRFVNGQEMTAVVYIDHNMGTLVKDAFIVPEPLAELERLMRTELGDDSDTVWRDIEPADARTKITDGIRVAAMTAPPFESDTWPGCRPIVEWLVRKLPEGGSGYVRPEWSESDGKRLADRFFVSAFGAPLDDMDHRALLDDIVWFGAEYGPGDPLRWSPVAVEIILGDWIPRKIVADAAYLTKVPELLRAFVRFCHAERGIRTALTLETLAAVDRCEPEYQRVIRSKRRQGPLALLERIGVIDPDEFEELDDLDDFEDYDDREYAHRILLQAAGSDEALRALDDRPLPDEEFDWTGLADDVREKVADVLARCDGCADELFDVEYRTACRRLLARAAVGDPSVFRRRGSTATAAAAICWVVGKDNDLFSIDGGSVFVKDMMAQLGVSQSGASQRADTMMKAAGFDPYAQIGTIRLGVPALLTSRRRRYLIALRDEYLDDD